MIFPEQKYVVPDLKFFKADPSWTQKMIRLIQHWRNILQTLIDPSFKEEQEKPKRGDSRNDNRDFGV